jgi:energy-converting hydrogenase Eha subunit G
LVIASQGEDMKKGSAAVRWLAWALMIIGLMFLTQVISNWLDLPIIQMLGIVVVVGLAFLTVPARPRKDR